ncbi:MAG: alpha/beta fold hydrolase, partial [Propionibacteriales bacterium]|nr:alpha/beta fold hydrolase [Propionibacteriales bacterium]
HLLVPNPAGSATNWVDVFPALRRYGRVVAVDLPGTIAGHTDLPDRRAAGVEPNARFLRAFTSALGLDRVVVHGWSAGGIVALLFADIAPDRVVRIVLVTPALPPPISVGESRWWRTVGRVGLAVAPPVARGLLRLFGRRLLDLNIRILADPAGIVGTKWDLGGGDLGRISPEFTELTRDEFMALQPKQLDSSVTVIASIFSAMFVRRHRVQEAMRRAAAPTLLLWGDDDRLITRKWIDDWTAQRPDWNLSVFENVGHALPIEVPDAYAQAVGEWMASTRS